MQKPPRPCGRRGDDDLRQLGRGKRGIARELELSHLQIPRLAGHVLGGGGSRGDEKKCEESELRNAPRESVRHQPLGVRSQGPAGPLVGSGGSGSRASASGGTNGVRWIKSCTR